MSAGSQTDRLGHVVVRGRNGQRNIARDMNELALCQQREASQRIGVLAARQPAESAKLRVINPQTRSIAAGPGELLRPRRYQLTMLAHDPPVGSDEYEGVVQNAQGNGAALIHSNDDMGTGFPGSVADDGNFRSRHQNRGTHELFEPRASRHGVGDPIPIGIAWNENFGEGNQLRALGRSCTNQRRRLHRRGLGFQEHRCSLDRRRFEDFERVHDWPAYRGRERVPPVEDVGGAQRWPCWRPMSTACLSTRVR